MAPTPRDVALEIGEQYVNDYPVVPADPDELERVKQAFDTMAEVNDRLFRDIPIPVDFQEDDPYDDYQDMRDTVAREGRLRVFTGGDPHPYWGHHEEVTSRAVHDMLGHLTLDVDFSVEGEYRKWEHSRSHYPAYCEGVFFVEVVAQWAAVAYLDDGFSDPRYKQKIFEPPREWIDRMSLAVEEAE